MRSITISAPAKLNLFLHITGKRADGYHLLDSLVVFTKFGDELKVTEAPELSLDIIGEYASAISHESPENNLVYKAARTLQTLLPYPRSAKITLTKNIPVGAGIGGGSADAAAALHALNELWELKLSPEKLSAIALSLGADVPVCLAGKPAYMRGIGEEITPVEFTSKTFVLLVNPNVALPTAQVFKLFDGTFYKPTEIQPVIDSLEFLGARGNDLQAPAIATLGVIEDILHAIGETEGCILARMSGSGATCFGLYDTEAAAQKAHAHITHIHPAWWATHTSLLTGAAHG